MELTDEEIAALKKVDAWVKGDWRDNCQEEGYFEACVLGLLLDRFSSEVKSNLNPLIDAITK